MLSQIINMYFKLVADHCQSEKENCCRVYAFSSFFYEKLTTHGYTGIRTWTKKPKIYAYTATTPMVWQSFFLSLPTGGYICTWHPTYSYSSWGPLGYSSCRLHNQGNLLLRFSQARSHILLRQIEVRHKSTGRCAKLVIDYGRIYCSHHRQFILEEAQECHAVNSVTPLATSIVQVSNCLSKVWVIIILLN